MVAINKFLTGNLLLSRPCKIPLDNVNRLMYIILNPFILNMSAEIKISSIALEFKPLPYRNFVTSFEKNMNSAAQDIDASQTILNPFFIIDK